MDWFKSKIDKDIKKVIDRNRDARTEYELPIEDLEYLINKYPNDMELGKKIRNYINKIKDEKY